MQRRSSSEIYSADLEQTVSNAAESVVERFHLEQPNHQFPSQCPVENLSQHYLAVGQTDQHEQNHSVASDQNYSMASEQNHSLTSLNSMTSDYSGYEDGMYSGGDVGTERFEYTTATAAENTSDDVDLANNPTARVLKHLNKIVCDKVNVELEEFGNTLQSLLSQQFSQVTHLVSISKPDHASTSQESKSTQVQGEIDAFQYAVTGSHHRLQNVQSYCESGVDMEEFNKSQYLVQLLTAASAITQAFNSHDSDQE